MQFSDRPPEYKKPRDLHPKSRKSIDDVIARRIRVGRMLAGHTQKTMAEQLGITKPQYERYEYKVDKLSASRLYHISMILKLPIEFFFKNV